MVVGNGGMLTFSIEWLKKTKDKAATEREKGFPHVQDPFYMLVVCEIGGLVVNQRRHSGKRPVNMSRFA